MKKYYEYVEPRRKGIADIQQKKEGSLE